MSSSFGKIVHHNFRADQQPAVAKLTMADAAILERISLKVQNRAPLEVLEYSFLGEKGFEKVSDVNLPRAIGLFLQAATIIQQAAIRPAANSRVARLFEVLREPD